LIIVSLVIPGKIVPNAGVYKVLSFTKKIFSPGHSATYHSKSNNNASSKPFLSASSFANTLFT